jgi:deoxyribodipyrimidine photo-lyase
MRDSLRKHGSDLLLRFGKMEEVTRDVVRALRDNGDEVLEVFLQSEVSRPARSPLVRVR